MFHSTRDLLCFAAPEWTEYTGGWSCSINRETYKYCSNSDATGGSCRGDSVVGSGGVRDSSLVMKVVVCYCGCDSSLIVEVVVCYCGHDSSLVVEVVVLLLWSW